MRELNGTEDVGGNEHVHRQTLRIRRIGTQHLGSGPPRESYHAKHSVFGERMLSK